MEMGLDASPRKLFPTGNSHRDLSLFLTGDLLQSPETPVLPGEPGGPVEVTEGSTGSVSAPSGPTLVGKVSETLGSRVGTKTVERSGKKD